MNNLLNLDLFSVGIVIAITGMLGFIVFFNNSKSATHKSFLFFCLMTIAWGTLNFMNYKIPNPVVAFWLLRASIFFAVWHAFSLFLLLYTFPKPQISLPKSYRYGLLPMVILTSILTLTPFVFSRVSEVSEAGRILKVANGPAIALFSTMVFGLILSSIILFIIRYRKAHGDERSQMRSMLIGIVLTFSLILTFNFIFPAFLSNPNYISFGGVFIFPFIIFTCYALFRHNLLNIKVISAEILTVVLALAFLIEIIISKEITVIILRSSGFLLVVSVGVLLIRSVRKEVQQREQLQVLTEELKQVNEKLKTLDKARADFISIASHQLRTPPATLKWYIAAILSGDYGALQPEVKLTLEKAQVTNNSQISLIDDLLNASRIERGKMEFLFEQTDIDAITKLAVDQLQPQALMKKLTLTYEPSKQVLMNVMADREKLRQVINNMVDNSIKYTTSGSVTVKTKADKDNVYVSVTDTGKGISKEQLEKLFEKYNRGQDSAMHATGLGLGMYVAKVIVEQHKGKIWAESPGENKGATFIFSIPIHSEVKATTMFDLSKG